MSSLKTKIQYGILCRNDLRSAQLKVVDDILANGKAEYQIGFLMERAAHQLYNLMLLCVTNVRSQSTGHRPIVFKTFELSDVGRSIFIGS